MALPAPWAKSRSIFREPRSSRPASRQGPGGRWRKQEYGPRQDLGPGVQQADRASPAPRKGSSSGWPRQPAARPAPASTRKPGVVILTADVAFNSSVGGNPLAVRAHHAQFDRASRLLYLLQDVTDYADSHSSSDQATVSFRADGSAYQVQAEGHVVLTGSDGQQINTRIAHIDLGPKSEPEQAIMDGGLLYVANNARTACFMGRPRPGRCCSALNQPSGTHSCAMRFPSSTRRSYPRSICGGARPGRTRPNRPPGSCRPRKSTSTLHNRPGPPPASRSHSRRRERAAERAHHLCQDPARGHHRTRRSTVCDAGGRGGSLQPARDRPHQPGHASAPAG